MHLRTYVRTVALSWWNLMAVAGATLAIVGGVTGIDTPWWLWLALILGGVVLAQAQAATKAVHGGEAKELGPSELVAIDEAEVVELTPTGFHEAVSPVAALGAYEAASPSRSPSGPTRLRELDPTILRGRVYPYMYSRVVDPTEKALPVRVALAARIPSDVAAEIESDGHQAFEDAVATSVIERWILSQTTLGRPDYQHLWEPVDPNTSWIATLRRPPVRLMQKGWTLDAQAAVISRATSTPGVGGWLTMTLDTVIRPTEQEMERSRPLSFEELYELAYVMTSAMLDEIGPAVSMGIVGEYDLLSLATLIMPTAGSFGEFVPLDWINGQRATGTGDVPGAEWYPASRDEIDDPDARAESLRRWFKKILRDSGFIRGYDADIARLKPPGRLPPAPD
jgi:hypothetical protein